MLSSDSIQKVGISSAAPRWALWAVGVSLAMLILLVPLPLTAPAPVERHFYIEASSFAYSPETIRVEPGDRVTIELMATDVIHGIYIDGYGLQASADPGQTARLSFIADRPGLFRFRCAVPCGAMHPFMIGKLQVGPNLLPARAGLVLLLSVVFMAIWLRKAPPATT